MIEDSFEEEPDRLVVVATATERSVTDQDQGMFALTAAASVTSTRTVLPRERLRLRFLFWRRWRLPCLRRSTLPLPVILNRLLTAFLVLEMPAFLDIGVAKIGRKPSHARKFYPTPCFSTGEMLPGQPNLDFDQALRVSPMTGGNDLLLLRLARSTKYRITA